MSRGKLSKFADITANPLVIEPHLDPKTDALSFPLKGNWHDGFFHNHRPIVVELGCGRGEYTIGLALSFPENNYIGVDIKGARIWTGAQEALRRNMKNVAFLRTNIEFIHHLFAPDEVSELWLTFSDPQMKKATKRLTSTYFLQRYRHFLIDAGLVHLKTDSNFLFTYTKEMLRANYLPCEVETEHLYADETAATAQARLIQTHYEQMWRSQGVDIKYLRFRLPHAGTLTEPDVDIPFDEYRSYHRTKRSDKATGR